jgi:hypothetical protein
MFVRVSALALRRNAQQSGCLALGAGHAALGTDKMKERLPTALTRAHTIADWLTMPIPQCSISSALRVGNIWSSSSAGLASARHYRRDPSSKRTVGCNGMLRFCCRLS